MGRISVEKETKVAFGKVVFLTESKMPALEIKLDGEETGLFVLPFRGYRFQITNERGNGDFGSSEVIGLGNIILMTERYQSPRNTSNVPTSLFSSNVVLGSTYCIFGEKHENTTGEGARAIFKSMIIEAMVRFCKGNGEFYVGFEEYTILDEFTIEVYKWIKEQMKNMKEGA